MAFAPLISAPHVRGLALSFAGFAAMFLFLAIVIAPELFSPGRGDAVPLSGVGRITVTVWGFVQYIVPGFIVGYVARRSPLMHGWLLGALSALFIRGYEALSVGGDAPGSAQDLVWWILIGGIWCSAGAIVGDHVGTRRKA
jgi:hypothetical protein